MLSVAAHRGCGGARGCGPRHEECRTRRPASEPWAASRLWGDTGPRGSLQLRVSWSLSRPRPPYPVPRPRMTHKPRRPPRRLVEAVKSSHVFSPVGKDVRTSSPRHGVQVYAEESRGCPRDMQESRVERRKDSLPVTFQGKQSALGLSSRGRRRACIAGHAARTDLTPRGKAGDTGGDRDMPQTKKGPLPGAHASRGSGGT